MAKAVKKQGKKKTAPVAKASPKKAAPAKTKTVSAKKTPARGGAPVKAPDPGSSAEAQKQKKAVPQRKSIVIVKTPPPQIGEINTAKSRAFAMSIAQEMKRSARDSGKQEESNGIRLAKRPTTRTQGKNTVKFPSADLKEFRKRLIEERRLATRDINAMKATGFNETDDREADGGDGTAQTLRLQALGQMGNFNRTVQKIDEALHRIDDGTYGVCTVCGQLIRKARLLNQPFVLTCMECQNEMERNRQ